MAMSWGKGDPNKDGVFIIYMDEAGRLREHTKLDDLFGQENKDEFLDMVNRRRPDVIVIGGFSIATTKLARRIKELLGIRKHPDDVDNNYPALRPGDSIIRPVIYVHDEVARLYQNSRRADEEFSSLSSLHKYCVGLARYVQSPLNEYAALGGDIAAITFQEDYQQLVWSAVLLSSCTITHPLPDSQGETPHRPGASCGRHRQQSRRGH